MRFWTLFGTSNQLLAALTLMGVAVWLHREGRRCWYVLAPMAFVLAITCWALVVQIVSSPDLAIRGTAAALLLFAAFLAYSSVRAVLSEPRASASGNRPAR